MVFCMSFRDRLDAGRQLAVALAKYRHDEATVLALPRGGVPVAAEVARALDAPLDLILVRKVGVPFQPELAMGAVVDGAQPVIVRNEDVIALTGISGEEFEAACQRELTEIERRRQRYLADRQRAPIAGRVAIVIDDGIATGATVRAALQATPHPKAAGIGAGRSCSSRPNAGRPARGRRRHYLSREPRKLRGDWIVLCGFPPDQR